MRTVVEAPALIGTVFDAAHATLDRSPHYRSFRANGSSRDEFHRFIETQSDQLQAAAGPKSDVPFMKRFPRRPHAYAMPVVADLRRRGILPAANRGALQFGQTERMMAH